MVQKIKIFLGIAVMAAVLFGGLTFSQSAFAGNDEKVTICHQDQETGEQKTISVKVSSVSAHLANHEGDHVGECVASTCEECSFQLGEAFEACGEGNLECELAAINAFGVCSLTCQGDYQDIPQQCFNDAAPILVDCSDSTNDGLQACEDDWLESIFECTSP